MKGIGPMDGTHPLNILAETPCLGSRHWFLVPPRVFEAYTRLLHCSQVVDQGRCNFQFARVRAVRRRDVFLTGGRGQLVNILLHQVAQEMQPVAYERQYLWQK